MTNPNDLLDAIVDYLQGMSGLTALVSESDIAAYKHQFPDSSWMAALRKQKPAPSIAVLWRGTSIGRWGGIPSRQHNFVLVIRDGAGASAAEIWTALVDGGFTSAAAIHADVEMVQDPQLEMRTIATTDTSFLDYWEASFSLTEKFAG